MDHQSIANRIIELRNADLAFRNKLIATRQLGKGYHPEMEHIHNKNAKQLDQIMDQIGYPTIEKVGKEASEAAWLVIQHAISQPQFMKKCAQLLERAVKEQQANPKNLAYLTDRIAVFSGQPQRYGTAFDWDDDGVLSPNLYDDLSLVNQRRKAIGLNTLEEQTQIIRKQAETEKQIPPSDLEERKHAYEEWKRKVGWIK